MSRRRAAIISLKKRAGDEGQEIEPHVAASERTGQEPSRDHRPSLEQALLREWPWCPRPLPLPRRSAIRIGRGLHVMIEGLQATPAPGKVIPLTLRFAHAGPMELSIPVLRYSEALTALGE